MSEAFAPASSRAQHSTGLPLHRLAVVYVIAACEA
jgi:hypothetical protein